MSLFHLRPILIISACLTVQGMPGLRGATGASGPRGPPGDAGRAGEPGPAGLRVSSFVYL